LRNIGDPAHQRNGEKTHQNKLPGQGGSLVEQLQETIGSHHASPLAACTGGKTRPVFSCDAGDSGKMEWRSISRYGIAREEKAVTPELGGGLIGAACAIAMGETSMFSGRYFPRMLLASKKNNTGHGA
jgi:hypothetical protein